MPTEGWHLRRRHFRSQRFRVGSTPIPARDAASRVYPTVSAQSFDFELVGDPTRPNQHQMRRLSAELSAELDAIGDGQKNCFHAAIGCELVIEGINRPARGF